MNEASRWGGVWTALVTPFMETGELDSRALGDLVAWQVASGVHGLVPCGTTGEGATLSLQEQEQVVRTVVESAAGRVPVVAGCGTNDTRRTVEAAERVVRAGADGVLVVTPYYNKPNPSGMLAHYRAVAEAAGRPVVVYNVPGRTGQNLGVELTLRLAEIPGIVGIKEASGNLSQIMTLLAQRPPGFRVFSGDDELTLPMMALGAEGVISVVSNEAPQAMARLVEACAEGRWEEARSLHFRLLPLMRANFVESNPVPVKWAMARLGRCREEVRLPLGPANEATRRSIEAALAGAGLL